MTSSSELKTGAWATIKKGCLALYHIDLQPGYPDGRVLCDGDVVLLDRPAPTYADCWHVMKLFPLQVGVYTVQSAIVYCIDVEWLEPVENEPLDRFAVSLKAAREQIERGK